MSSIARPDPSKSSSETPPVADEQEAILSAGLLLKGGNVGAVGSLLEPWLETAQFPDTFTLLARAHIASGRLTEAEAVLRIADHRFPDDPKMWKALAVLYRTLMRPSDEIAYRRKLVYLQPNPPLGAYVQLAEAAAAMLREDPHAAQGELRFVSKKLSALPITDESDRAVRLALAQSLYQVPDLQDDAYKHYAAARPVPSNCKDFAVQWMRLHDWCAHSGATLQRAADGGRPGHRPMLAEVSRVAVLPSFQWTPVLDEPQVAISGFLMRRLVFHAADPHSPLLLHRTPDRSVLRLPRELPTVSGPALLLGGIAAYYHQTVEYLGTLAIAEELGVPADVPLLVNHDLAPFQLEQLAMLGIGEERLIRVRPDTPMRFERVWIASRPVMGGRWIDPIMPAWYRRRLGLALGPGRRKLYLTRAGTNRRRIANEADVVSTLSRRGYETVRLEAMTVREQVDLLADASHIVAPTGAALTNMIFTPPGARVVAVYNRAFAAVDADLYFDALAAACGHHFTSLMATAVAAHESSRVIDADIWVDVAELELAIEAVDAGNDVGATIVAQK